MRVQYRRYPYPWVKLSVPNGRIPRASHGDVERACTPRIAAPRVLPTVRPVGGDYVTHPYWLPLWKDDLAWGAILDSIYCHPRAIEDVSADWRKMAIRSTPHTLRRGDVTVDFSHGLVDLEASQRSCSSQLSAFYGLLSWHDQDWGADMGALRRGLEVFVSCSPSSQS
jgi:hypothetical protein